MKEKKMSQISLSLLTGISRSRINAIAGGEAAGMHIVTLLRIAGGLETTPDCMLGLALDRPLMPGVAPYIVLPPPQAKKKAQPVKAAPLTSD
jgi:transcriptional regulator with XRE-family HTH domain